jgi:putative exosortase-associated protein (TIGR04073 family)
MKNIFAVLFIVCMLMFGTTTFAKNTENPPEKLVKAVTNTGIGCLEIIKQPIIGATEPDKNPVLGGIAGFFKGIGKATKRVGGGIIDIVTFWDGNESLVKTYLWQEWQE